MNFDLNDEHRMIRDMAHEFADETIASRAEEMEASGEFPYDMEEYPVSRYYKGAKLLQIVEGASEVQRMLLGRILAEKPMLW
jgi:alkylation response protein AidB-like acyl-CoA dehydrogenase